MNVDNKSRARPRLRTLLFLLCGFATWVACGALIAPQNWDQGRGPVVPHDTFPADCRLCHTGEGWNEIREDFEFDHAKETGVPLDGAHAQAECLRCHNDRGPVAMFADRGCAGCHLDIHKGQLGMSCDTCHGQSNWVPEGPVSRHDSTRFPLVGAHVAVGCFACHPGAEVGNFAGLDTRCETCHVREIGRSSSLDHVSLGLTQDCQRCHTPIDWQRARFDHPPSFPLASAHGGLDCARCHVNRGNFGGLSADCVTCHREEYDRTNDPNHRAAGFSTDCAQCHTATSWDNSRFDHPQSFGLGGGHAGQRCSACHGTSGSFGGLSTDCASCHRDDFDRTSDPNHAQLGFPLDCTRCHTTASWESGRFDHPQSFSLVGGHSGRRCSECHGTSGVFSGLSTECASCHRDDYDAVTDPNHRQLGFPLDCTRCHTLSTWQGGQFDHPGSFPLSAGHSGRRCSQCHGTSGVFSGLSTVCISCHRGDFDATTDPHHRGAGFSQDCTECHTTTGWGGARYQHPSGFALTAGHAGRRCSECHGTSGVYTGLATSCVSCHRDDYDATTDPNHRGANFSLDCTQCHGTAQWSGATFNHPAGFALTNAHAGRRCSDCHGTTGNYGGLSTACASCHRDDYNRAQNPNHISLGYPLDCTHCHGTTAWSGARFTHRFPITTGDHRGLRCTDCHLQPSSFVNFSCTHCHDHNQTEMGNEHRRVSGYVWSSPDCYRCHPQGR
ncbi:MAG: cytochrome c3 family protein [Planctomycetota bacterium]